MPKSPTNGEVARSKRMHGDDAKARFSSEDDHAVCMQMFEDHCQTENIDPESRKGKRILRCFTNDFAECAQVRREFEEILTHATVRLEQLRARMESACIVPTERVIHRYSNGSGGRIYDHFPELFGEETHLCKLVSVIGSRTYLTLGDSRGIEECHYPPKEDDSDGPPSPNDVASRPLSPCPESPYDGEAATPDFGGEPHCCRPDNQCAACMALPSSPGCWTD